MERLKLWVLKAVLKWYGGSVMYKVGARDCMVSSWTSKSFVSDCTFFHEMPIEGNWHLTVGPMPAEIRNEYYALFEDGSKSSSEDKGFSTTTENA